VKQCFDCNLLEEDLHKIKTILLTLSH